MRRKLAISRHVELQLDGPRGCNQTSANLSNGRVLRAERSHESTSLIPRLTCDRLAEAVLDSPVVLIHGPRQCGKTTLAAAQTAQLFNLSDLAGPFRLSRPTIGDYVALLEQVFLIHRLPPWHSNRLSRLIKTHKLHLGDTGVACAVLDQTADTLREDRPMLGHLLETYVVQELRRQASWNEEHIRFHHFRNKDGAEVDAVLERTGRKIVGVEVKLSGTVVAKDFRGLKKLREASGDRFTAGVVLYDGEEAIPFGHGLAAVPLSRIWVPG